MCTRVRVRACVSVFSYNPICLLILYPHCVTTDAEIKVQFAENSELSKVPILKP